MKDGFIKVAAATPKVRVGDVIFNTQEIIKCIKTAAKQQAKLVVMPELSITSYTCGDLFFQTYLISDAACALKTIADKTKDLDILSVVGLPVNRQGKLYNCAAFLKDGKILGFVPKCNLPNYGEFYELRYFDTIDQNTTVNFFGDTVPFGPNLVFSAKDMPAFSVSAEICEDLWAPVPPSCDHCANGANIIVNLSAGSETIGKSRWRQNLVEVHSSKNICGYVYADAGEGESTTDMVFSGHNMVYEAGTRQAESKLFSEDIIYGDIDTEYINQERTRTTTFKSKNDNRYLNITFNTKITETQLTRTFDMHPFIPADDSTLSKRCEEIFAIQYHGLKKRLAHINAKTVTIGISGGLDSTLALLVTAKAFDSLNLKREDIIAVTMPCFGTTDRTYNNAVNMVKSLGATLIEVDIKKSVTQHLADIGADISCHDVTYENAQARERTQVLMDIANKTGGIVIGTGDLSELALGFATYNGDHMSMYGPNASIPKTLVRHLVRYVAALSDKDLKETLLDVLDTPVSPELLPPDKDGTIVQQTEDIVGPYELHDFFLYYMIRKGFSKEKICRLAKLAFAGIYDDNKIEICLTTFMKRFFANQFKRSCLPDGVKVGSVGLSPRGDWRMPSDAVYNR